VAKVLDLVWDEGSRFQLLVQPVIDWLPSIAGYSARGQVRSSRTLPDAELLLDFSAYLSVNSGQGTVLLDLPGDALIGADWSRGVYDIELFDGNPAHDVRFLQGKVTIDREATK
jgi:hypothetical protein